MSLADQRHQKKCRDNQTVGGIKESVSLEVPGGGLGFG